MKNMIVMMTVLAIFCVAAPMARAEDKDARTDKAVFRQLVRETTETHRQYSTAYHRGVGEARKNGGTASPETKATLLSLRDEIDRKTNRILLIALRHGWEIPWFDLDNPGAPTEPKSRKEEVLAPADALIRTAFAQEARALAASVRLPVVSIAATRPTRKSGFSLGKLFGKGG